MEVQVNKKSQQAEEGATLRQLLNELGFEETRGLAVAINDLVVPKVQWTEYQLQPKDNITIIRATQGG